MEHPDDDLPASDPDATCAHHEGRPAFVRCPVCRKDVCVACFFVDAWRCQRCIEAAPEELAPHPAFEARGGVAGFAASVREAFSPRRTAPGFGLPPERDRALVFFLSSFVPVAFGSGIIPYTRYLHFGSAARVVVTRGHSSAEIALDVLRAGGLGFLQSAVLYALFALCYASLVRGFGRPEAGDIARRALLYKGFLMPLGGPYGLFFYAALTILPGGELAQFAALLLATFPTLALLVGLHRAARTVCRVDALPGFAASIVPLVLLVITYHLSQDAMARVVPLPIEAEAVTEQP